MKSIRHHVSISCTFEDGTHFVKTVPLIEDDFTSSELLGERIQMSMSVLDAEVTQHRADVARMRAELNRAYSIAADRLSKT